MAEPTYEELGAELVRSVPRIVQAYKDLVKTWKGKQLPGPHLVYGAVLNPHLMSLLGSDGNEAELKEIFALLERLSTNPDKHVQEIVEQTVLERIGDDRVALKRARTLMGPATRKHSDDVEKYWGRRG